MLLLSKHGGNAFVLMFLQLFFAALFFISSVSCDGGGNEIYYRVIDDPHDSFRTIYYCKLTNQETNTHGCLDDKNAQFNVLKKFKLSENHMLREETRKVDLAVHKEASRYSMIPFEKLGFPIFSRLYKGSIGFTALMLRMAYGIPESNNPDLPMFSSVHVYDFTYKCKDVIPLNTHGNTIGDYIGAVAYMNQKYNEYGWLFFKKNEHICMYYAKFEDLYDGHWGIDDTNPNPKSGTKRVEDSNGKLHLTRFDHYPTQNYLMRFFAFDPLFGCFVSMYWDGDRNHDPEAHFFKFDESNPLASPELVYSYALPDFNKDLLQSVLEERFLDAVQIVFQSYGGQIFVFGRHPDTCNGFIGHYKDPYVYYTKDMPSTTEDTKEYLTGMCDYNNRDIPTNLNEVPLMYVKEDWITFTIPAYKMNGPIPLPTPPPSTSITTSTTTTTEKPTSSSTSSTEAPSSSPVPTSTSTAEPVSSTEVSSTSDHVTQTPEPTLSSSTLSPLSSSTENASLSSSSNSSSSPLPSNSTNEKSLPYIADETTTSDGSKSLCSSYVDDCLWCLILLIIIDVLLLVIFIVLIIFERRGANQRKSESVEETEAATTAAGTEMSKHSTVKSQKKSKTKKSQSETVGNTTAAGDETTIKKVDTIDDIKHKNLLCVFDSETKICRLAAIYPNEKECENYYNFIESNKTSLSINEKEAKLLYKNNFLMILLALKIDEPSIFVPALDVVISGLLELKLNEPASPPLPKVPEPTKTPVPSCMLPKWILPIKCANYSKMDDEAPVNLENVSTPKNKPSQTFQPATSSVPRCKPKLQNSSPLNDVNKEAADREASNHNPKESNSPTTTADDSHLNTPNSQKPERTADNEQQHPLREPKEPYTPAASQSHDDTPRTKTSQTPNSSNCHHRKRSRFNDDDSDRKNEEPDIKK